MFNLHDVALLLSVVLGLSYSYLAALATREPSWLTGIITTALSAASALIAELIAAPNNYDWQKALGTAILTWAMALGAQKGHLSGTDVQTKLHRVGTKKAA